MESRRRPRQAELLQRVFEIDALRCPRCGSTLRLIAAIEDPVVARRILECLKFPARAPPLEPASRAAIPAESIDPTSVSHVNTPNWYRSFPIEDLMAQVITKINSRGSVTGI
jgi:hypothetical protein